MDGNHKNITGIYRFPQTIIMGNIKWQKEEYELEPVSVHVCDYTEWPGEEMSLLRTGGECN